VRHQLQGLRHLLAAHRSLPSRASCVGRHDRSFGRRARGSRAGLLLQLPALLLAALLRLQPGSSGVSASCAPAVGDKHDRRCGQSGSVGTLPLLLLLLCVRDDDDVAAALLACTRGCGRLWALLAGAAASLHCRRRLCLPARAGPALRRRLRHPAALLALALAPPAVTRLPLLSGLLRRRDSQEGGGRVHAAGRVCLRAYVGLGGVGAAALRPTSLGSFTSYLLPVLPLNPLLRLLPPTVHTSAPAPHQPAAAQCMAVGRG
jgi:hypothetical protein